MAISSWDTKREKDTEPIVINMMIAWNLKPEVTVVKIKKSK